MPLGSWLTSPARSPRVLMSPSREKPAATNTSAKSLSEPRRLPSRSESGKSASTPCSSSTAPPSANRLTTARRRCAAEGHLLVRGNEFSSQCPRKCRDQNYLYDQLPSMEGGWGFSTHDKTKT